MSRLPLLLPFLFLFLAACAGQVKTDEAAPAPTPSPSPTPAAAAAEPLAPSLMSEPDHKYALHLEKVLNNLRPGREERLILEYIRYLHYGDVKFARAFIEGLKKEAESREGLVPNVDLFEGAYAFCHFEKEMCVRSIGSLTQTYLVPRLKAGESAALELFVVHGGLTDRDGAEAENYDEIAALREVARHGRAIADFKKKYRKLFQSVQ